MSSYLELGLTTVNRRYRLHADVNWLFSFWAVIVLLDWAKNESPELEINCQQQYQILSLVNCLTFSSAQIYNFPHTLLPLVNPFSDGRSLLLFKQFHAFEEYPWREGNYEQRLNTRRYSRTESQNDESFELNAEMLYGPWKARYILHSEPHPWNSHCSFCIFNFHHQHRPQVRYRFISPITTTSRACTKP